MAKNLNFVLLLDCYGELLTQRQREIAELYYNEDFSLTEIAQIQQISRQAVSDSLRHSEQILQQTETKLGMAERIGNLRNCLEQILVSCQTQNISEITELAANGLQLL
ncbi:MAG: DNA-binding protein [Oscillospiraceae bacterium]|nr:DNA-binding protein [Oscillospiraceae bacterium]